MLFCSVRCEQSEANGRFQMLYRWTSYGCGWTLVLVRTESDRKRSFWTLIEMQICPLVFYAQGLGWTQWMKTENRLCFFRVSFNLLLSEAGKLALALKHNLKKSGLNVYPFKESPLTPMVLHLITFFFFTFAQHKKIAQISVQKNKLFVL